jgi:hypothetical protein
VLEPGDPQRLNPYSYARNNPITMGDPDGLEPRPWHNPEGYDEPWNPYGESTTGESVTLGSAYNVPVNYSTDSDEQIAAAERVNGLMSAGYVAADSTGFDLFEWVFNDTKDAVASCTTSFHAGWCAFNLATTFTPARPLRYSDEAASGLRLLLHHADDADDAAEAGAAAERKTAVIGRQPDTAVAKDWAGHEVLDLPAKEWSIARNDQWVRSVIDRKMPVYVGSPTTWPNLWDAAAGRSTVFGRELRQFTKAGYTWDGWTMIPPGG